MEVATKELSIFEKTKAIMRSNEVIEKFAEVLGAERAAKKYIGSVLLAVGQSDKLQECTPQSIMISGMRAATLKLSVDPSLGHAYLVPFKNKGVPTATFIVGYKGLKQLAYRTGQYKFINEKIVYEGQSIEEDDFSGIQRVVGMPTYHKDGFKPIGYWMGFELKSGFRQTFYMTIEEVLEHGKRYSKTYDKTAKDFRYDSKWKTDFDSMALKTVIRLCLTRYGYFDENDYLSMSEQEFEEFDDEWSDDFIDGELLDSALEQEEERIEGLVGGKSTDELSAMLGFDDPNDGPAKPKRPAAEKKKLEAVDMGGVVKSSMSLETAENVTNSKGEKYGELDTELLSNMANSIAKAMKENGMSHEKHEEHQMKLDAIKVILASRNG